jgi:hypothetical protein
MRASLGVVLIVFFSAAACCAQLSHANRTWLLPLAIGMELPSVLSAFSRPLEKYGQPLLFLIVKLQSRG